MDYLEKKTRTIFYEGPNSDPFWSFSASDFTTGLTLGLFEDAQKEEINLNSINMMIQAVNEKFGAYDYLTNYFKLKNQNSQSYICASPTILSPQETKKSIISVAKQKLKTYTSREKLSALMNKTTFNYEDITNKKTAIFFIAKEENKYLNTLAAMFIEQLFTILLDTNNSNNFNSLLDNFDVIEKVNELTDMLSSGLSRKIKFIISTRSLEDLTEKYGTYIIKLSNIIYVEPRILKTKIDGEEELVENKFEKITDIYNEVNYPRLITSPLKIFNLKKFVEETKTKSIKNILNEVPTTSTPPNNPFFPGSTNNKINIDKLIKSIDEKLEKLESQEKNI